MVRSWWLLGATLCLLAGCGHSEDEWQQKVHEVADLKGKLEAAQKQGSKTKGDFDEEAAKAEQLRQQLKAAGVDVTRLNENLEAQARAMDEYRRHQEQLEAWKKRHEVLKTKLAALAKDGVAVVVVDNRLAVRMSEGALFDAGRDTIKAEGRAALLKVAEAIKGEPALAARSFQIGAHMDPGSKGKDAWQASLLRAREVLRVMVQADSRGGGLPAAKWSAAGFGDAAPVRSNDPKGGKVASGRVEIEVLPEAGELVDLGSLAAP